MEISKLDRAIGILKKNQDAFCCPICGTRMKVTKSGRFICKKEHTFDVSKKGYINLLNETKKTNYDKELFKSRKEIFQQGFYLTVADEIKKIILEFAQSQKLEKINILDAGCGEGYYSNHVAELEQVNIFGFDISKEAVSLATDYPSEVSWCIADLSNLPFKERSMDIILDVFTPANYKEFKRVLKNQGLLIKAIPGDEYLKEIRELAAEQLSSKNYSNEDTVKYAESHMRLLGRKKICYAVPVTKDQVMDFIRMTPMTSRLDREALDPGGIKEVTVSVEILYGRV